MVKRILLCVGIGVILTGALGMGIAMSRWDESPETARDVLTTGRVVKIGKELESGSSQSFHKMSYSFVAANGETYEGSAKLDKSQLERTSQGDRIDVVYHSDNPHISSASAFENYVPIDKFSRYDPKYRIMISLGMVFLGSLFMLGAFQKSEDVEVSR